MMTEERFHEDESRGHTRMDYAEARKKSHEMQQRIERLLELQTNPEQLTDEQMQQILADDEMRQLVQQLGFAKRAFKHDALKNDTPDVDAEWEKFAAKHAELLDALDEDKPKSHSSFFTLHSLFQKIAASFIGVLLVSGIAIAAIWSLTPSPSPKGEGSEYSQVADTARKDTTPLSTRRGAGGEAPIVFDNVALEKMLSQIATYYNKEVEFQNDNARQFRFYFVWKPDEGLDVTLHRLNLFESVSVELNSDKIVVE